MDDKETLSIKSSDAPERVVEAGEKRAYYLFREIDPNFPLELIITEVPPGHTQPYHAHATIDEITVVLFGEIVGLTKDTKEGPVQEKKIKAVSLFDPDQHDFHRITASKDGEVTIVLEDRKSGEIIEKPLPSEEGFDGGRKFHTLENRTEAWATTATVKKTSQDTFQNNPKIFQEDKIAEI